MSATRREFLVDGLKVTALLPWLPSAGWSARGISDERVLVVLQLSGGNDALNMVVPRRQDAYYRLRPTLALKPSSLHTLDEDHGLHPAMSGLGELFAAGRLTVIHGVGYPRPDRSHFRSLEIWHTADPEHPPRTGWLGRLADQLAAGNRGALPAMHVGDEELPLALLGSSFVAPTVSDERSLELGSLEGLESARDELLADGDDGSDLGFLRTAARSAYRLSEQLSRITSGGSQAEYPGSGLGRKLRLIARLLAGGLDTRLFHVSMGGFDTHARQAATHAALLEELSSALSAFERDLATSGLGERVLTLVFSEFGRRAAENASGGTDHGAAAPVLVVGASGRGGVHGTPPHLEHLAEGDVPFTTDFRSVYAALEHDWLGLEPSTALPAFELFG